MLAILLFALLADDPCPAARERYQQALDAREPFDHPAQKYRDLQQCELIMRSYAKMPQIAAYIPEIRVIRAENLAREQHRHRTRWARRLTLWLYQ
jgi:hypothetical protein